MKKKFSKILGVGLTLALLTSLLLTAAPVSAISTPIVTLGAGNVPATDPVGVISKENVYTVLFTLGAVVPADGKIVVVFEPDTDITAMDTKDVVIASTPGIGSTGTSPQDGTAAVTGTYPAAQTLTITLNDSEALGAGAMVQLSIGDDTVTDEYVINPTTAGTYTLTVATQDSAGTVIEAAVPSGAYTIIVPVIPGLPGVAVVYNSVGIKMAQETGDDAIFDAIAVSGAGYTIQVGPGLYTENNLLDITDAKVTLVSTDGAADTTITGGNGISVSAADVTVDGFTVEIASGTAIAVSGADAIIQNNIITATAGYPQGINVTGSGATVSGNELSLYTTMHVSGTDITLSGNTFGAGINIDGGGTITITDNDIIGSEYVGIRFGASNVSDILIEGNTISGTTVGGASDGGIGFPDGTPTITNLEIIGNDITDNLGDGIVIPSTVNLVNPVIKFNTISGNADYGINNLSAGVDASLNYWGTDGVSKNGTVTTAPVLAGTADSVLSASDAVANATALNASTTVGVAVSEAVAATIAVAKYAANPQEAIAGAIAFYDVYVDQTATTPDVIIKFYTGDALTDVYLWAAGTQSWVKLDDADVGYSAFGGYVYAAVDPAMLAGTPFALVGGEAAATVLGNPEIVAPKGGDRDVPLTPTFAWTGIAGADGYYFQFADNANFVLPLVKLDGDLGRLIVTAYAYVTELPYSTAYYWRVKAVSGTIEAGDLAESAWVSSVFITKDEPVEVLPPVVVGEAPTLPDIIIEQPDIVVPLPAETPITPTWIYVIIGVGAVLVIALLVLIVRTRRVA